MKKIWIIGDSFSTDMSSDSWIKKLSGEYIVNNISENGISEYRIYRKFLDVRDIFRPDDIVIFCHTNPFRIFLPDRISYPTRSKKSHPKCDLVIGDALDNGWFWKLLTTLYLKYFFDEDQCYSQFDLMVNEMDRITQLKGCHVIHITGFQERDNIISIKDIFETHRGKINHMNDMGNSLVAERISKLL